MMKLAQKSRQVDEMIATRQFKEKILSGEFEHKSMPMIMINERSDIDDS